jgi:hypothetical protein
VVHFVDDEEVAVAAELREVRVRRGGDALVGGDVARETAGGVGRVLGGAHRKRMTECRAPGRIGPRASIESPSGPLPPDRHRPEERTRVQLLNDFIVFGTMATGSFVSGGLLTARGWDTVLWVSFALLALAIAALLVSRRAHPAAAAG